MYRTSGQLVAFWPGTGLVFVRQIHDHVVHVGKRGRRDDFFVCGVGLVVVDTIEQDKMRIHQDEMRTGYGADSRPCKFMCIPCRKQCSL